jgi:hypothetical protein
MLRISKQTRLKTDEIIERAAKFFGEGGEGMDEKERNPCCIFFEGFGGYVSVNLIDEDKNRVVDIETRELEYPVRRFLEKI